jgi:glycosyltransferase involved in cell wall biosynthesis
MPPLVSVCMPAYNAAPWIGKAIESALAQTWEDFELLIVDDGSSDATVEISSKYSDPRIRIEAGGRNIGAARNANRSIALSTGTYLKFLHADDTLAPSCVEEMVELALEDDRIGLVFAPREILSEGDPDPRWTLRYANLHERFNSLDRSNDGRALFTQLVNDGIKHNWIGEPTSVLLSRRSLEQTGVFNARLYQIADLDLWLRTMLGFRIGFIDKPLSVYRHHGRSITADNQRAGRDWLDRVWLLEGLLREPSLTAAERQAIERFRRVALRQAFRSQVSRIVHGRFDRELPAYLRYRVLAGLDGGRRLRAEASAGLADA